MKNSFFLIIPPQRKNPEHAKQFTEGALKQWVEKLPTANPSLATRLFHDLILEFNQLEMDASLRLDALEILRPSYIIIEDYLRSRLMQSNFPKIATDQKIMDILVAIEKEIALGYWIVVRDLTGKDSSWFQSKNTALSIQRCMKGLSAIVLTFYTLYRAIPDWIWIDLHALYRLGETLNKLSNKVPAEFNETVKTTTIGESYRQILLLSLAMPSRLMQKEITLVYQFLEAISPYLTIENHATPQHPIHCILHLDEDKPPYFQSVAHKSSDAGIRYLNFDKLFKLLKNKSKFTEPNLTRFNTLGAPTGGYSKISLDLLDYLEQRWLAAKLPENIIFTDRLNRFIAFGLEAAFDLQSTLATSIEQEIEYLVQSASETSLSCDFNKPSVLAIGSLVSLRKTGSPTHARSLGVLSKLTTFKHDNKLNFECDLLTNQFYAVNFEYLEEKKQPSRKKALLYGVRGQEHEERSFIIIESFMLKDGDIIRMFIKDENYPIILKDRKNVGLGYWQFECRRMPEAENPMNKKQGYDFI